MPNEKPQTGPTGFLMFGPNGDGVHLEFSDNRSWLTLFYQLPREILDKRKEYYQIPRCPYDVLRADDHKDLIDDDRFLELIWDSYAWAIWNNFQVPKEDGTYRSIPGLDRFYSGDFPLWRMAYYCVALMRQKFQSIGLGFQELYNIPPGIEVPFLSYRQWWNLVGNTFDLIIKEQDLQPVIDEIWQNRTLEDYSEYYSKVKAAFEAQWYHSRTKTGKTMMSLESLMENAGGGASLFEVPDEKDYAEDAVNRLFLTQFLSTLSEKDRTILSLQSDGLTDQEIAEKTGYKTHSAVVKRRDKIRESFDAYVKEEYAAYKETFDK